MFLWCSILWPMKNIFNFIDMLAEKIAWFIHFTFIWIIISRSLGLHDFRWDNGLFCLLYAYCFLLRKKWNARHLNAKRHSSEEESYAEFLKSVKARTKSIRMFGRSFFQTTRSAKFVDARWQAKCITAEVGLAIDWTRPSFSWPCVLSAITKYIRIQLGLMPRIIWLRDEPAFRC